MDTGTAPRKRGGRPPKLLTAVHQTSTETASSSASSRDDEPQSSASNIPSPTDVETHQQLTGTDGVAIAVSPTPEEQLSVTSISTAVAGFGGECRRSSRKKIIKFDVRDLLNKNRKPHKIQIEARIDSNAPTSPKNRSQTQLTTLSGGCGATGGVGGSASSTTAASSSISADLTSKQKTFIEKAAIFRRYSVSAEQHQQQQQNKGLCAPPSSSSAASVSGMGDAAAGKPPIVIDPAKIAQARRLSRTQEIFNASMLKSKQNSSLIIAQMESGGNSSSSVLSLTPKQRKAVAAGSGTAFASGRRVKNAPKVIGPPSVVELHNASSSSNENVTQKRRGRPPKSKNSLKTSSTKTFESRKEQEEEHASISSFCLSKKISDQTKLSSSTTKSGKTGVGNTKFSPEKATNWKEYKACLRVDLPGEHKPESAVVVADEEVHLTQEDVILEISSSSSSSESTTTPRTCNETILLKERYESGVQPSCELNESSKQRNFAAVSFLQESSNPNDRNVPTTEFIVAAVEEIMVESPTLQERVTISSGCNETVAVDETIQMQSEIEGLSDSTLTAKENSGTVLKIDTPTIQTPLDSSIEETQSVSAAPTSTLCRTTSSSESETNSERGTNIKPHHKKRDMYCRVSLKRFNIPPKTTSSGSCSSSSSSSSSAGSDTSAKSTTTNDASTCSAAAGYSEKCLKRIGKRSKRLQQQKSTTDEDEGKNLKEMQKKVFGGTDIEAKCKEENIVIESEEVKQVEESCERENTNIEAPKATGINTLVPSPKIEETNQTAKENLEERKDKTELLNVTKEETPTTPQVTEMAQSSFSSIKRKSKRIKDYGESSNITLTGGTVDLKEIEENVEETESLQRAKTVTEMNSFAENENIAVAEIDSFEPQPELNEVKINVFNVANEESEVKLDSKEPAKVAATKQDSNEQSINISKPVEVRTDAAAIEKDSNEPLHKLVEVATDDSQPPTIKERITLPLKKQVTKLKQFEIITANKVADKFIEETKRVEEIKTVEESRITEEIKAREETNPIEQLKRDSEPIVECKSVAEEPTEVLTQNEIIQSVSVETSTLLDILRTVQLNKESATTSSSFPPQAVTGSLEESFTKTTTIPSPPATGSFEDSTSTCESSLSSTKILQTTLSPTPTTSAKDSPVRSDTGSPQTIMKKLTRRYDRRSRRGEEEITHKTLEETFAEIAAQSSRAILAMAGRAEEEEKVLAVELSEVAIESHSNDTADHVPQATLANVLSSVECEAIKVTIVPEEISATTTVEVVASTSEIPTNTADILIELPSAIVVKDVVLTDVKTPVETKTVGTTITPTRRGRKPKNKAIGVSISPSAVEVTTIIPAENLMESTETAKKLEIQNAEKQKKSKKIKSPKNESNIAAVLEEISEPDLVKTSTEISPPIQHIPTIINKEERIPKQPPKKRLSKMHAEFVGKTETIAAASSAATAVVATHDTSLALSEVKSDSIDSPVTLVQEFDKVGKATGSSTLMSNFEEFNKEASSSSAPDSLLNNELELNKNISSLPSTDPIKKSAEEIETICPTASSSIKKHKKSKMNEDSCEKPKSEEEETSTITPKQLKHKIKKENSSLSIEQTATKHAKQKHKRLTEQTKSKVEKNTPKPLDNKDKPCVSSGKKMDKKKFLEAEDEAVVVELSKKHEEKTAKKRRQKKLKEAFEAALNDDLAKLKTKDTETASATFKVGPHTPEQLPESPEPLQCMQLPLTPTELDNKPPIEIQTECAVEMPETTTAAESEEDPDPLKDIEKFIADGVNLLKRGYKIDDDSVDEVINTPGVNENPQDEIEKKEEFKDEEKTKHMELTEASEIDSKVLTMLPINEHTKLDAPQPSLYETPADTPLVTPTASPPPKSPVMDVSSDEISGVRRSHRIKQITKAPKALVGRGLVRDKERFSLKDDVETKSHYSLDDHLMDLAEVEAKNAKFLKDMEERLSNFHVIKENEYKCERVISREARKMICDCFLTTDEEVRGELGCGEDCLNRLLMIECGGDCNVRERCTNKRFQKFLCSPCRVFRTEKKGFGIMADIEILPGEFILEYVGEVIDGEEFERRRTMYSLDKNRHYYFMALRSDAIIDATVKGNISRFINHSCDPNAETQKWTVNGELRIGFFSRKSIMPGEEITFDYQYQRYGREAQRCYCESSNCRGWIGEEPNSDEGEQVDDEAESDEENLAEGLLDDDDEDDTDESVDDAEEVQKKLEIAAAEAKLTPIDEGGVDSKIKIDEKIDAAKDKKKKVSMGEEERKETEEDPKSKFKKLLSKMAEKVATKKKQKQKEKKQRKVSVKSPSEMAAAKPRYLEDPDIEDEVNFLSRCGLKTQSDTLRLSRLMVRAKLPQTRLNLLQILRKGELPCRRLFLDYHGLRLLHGWMSEDGGDMNIRLALLETLETLPIANKTVLTDSKVYQTVRIWCGSVVAGSAGSTGRNLLSPSDESSKESSSSNSQQAVAVAALEVPTDLQKLASKLTASWESLPEIFRIPKRERIEQMKEHEREADRQYAAAATADTSRSLHTDRYQRDRFGRGLVNRYGKPYGSKDARNITIVGAGAAGGDPRRRSGFDNGNGGNGGSATGSAGKHLSKEQRREMFAAKVARDEAEKRLAEERREYETKCRFFGLDPKKTRPHELPFCVNPATGQWYSTDRQPITTPPSYAHVQIPVKSKSTDPADYQLPAVVNTLPAHWKFSITPQGKIYYYHIQYRIPQWEPPTPAQIFSSKQEVSQKAETAGTEAGSGSESDDAGGDGDSSDDDDNLLMGMDQAQLKAYIEKKIEMRRQKRYNRLVDERPISPRREEDRIYNQMEVRKYKENKEKIRKRKEEIRRKRAEDLKNSTLNMCTLGSLDDSTASGDLKTSPNSTSNVNFSEEGELKGIVPIQDYLLSSDEEDLKAECNNSPLIDKIVQGDKIVDELDALTTRRALKRQPVHRDLLSGTQVSTSSGSASGGSGMSAAEKYEHKRRKLEKKEKSKKSKESDSKYRKLKEKFRCEIAGIIVHYLKPYRKDSCFMGRIQSDEDFNHLARKLTHFVMIKELKYCESVGQTLVVTESVKNKSREFIKKYMAKYGDVYVKPENDPEFKDIPFTL